MSFLKKHFKSVFILAAVAISISVGAQSHIDPKKDPLIQPEDGAAPQSLAESLKEEFEERTGYTVLRNLGITDEQYLAGLKKLKETLNNKYIYGKAVRCIQVGPSDERIDPDGETIQFDYRNDSSKIASTIAGSRDKVSGEAILMYDHQKLNDDLSGLRALCWSRRTYSLNEVRPTLLMFCS